MLKASTKAPLSVYELENHYIGLCVFFRDLPNVDSGLTREISALTREVLRKSSRAESLTYIWRDTCTRV